MDIERKAFTDLNYVAIESNVNTLALMCFFKKAYSKLQKDVVADSNAQFFSKYSNVNWNKCCEKGIIAFIKMLFHKWNIEACVSIRADSNINRYQVKQLVAADSLQTKHIGSYCKLGDTYKKIIKYFQENNIQLADSSLEFYLNNPEHVKSEQLETLVIVPIK